MTTREPDSAATSSLAQALEMEGLVQSMNANTSDMREALVACVERRPANFAGR